MVADPTLEKWVMWFENQDEKRYWKSVTCEQHWENLIKQSDAFWPTFFQKIQNIMNTGKPAIFEGVNILPHLAAKDLTFSGIYLLGESLDATFERNKKDPRWGRTEELQKKEAEMFFHCESEMYRKEAEKYGYKTFRDIVKAEQEILKLLAL